MFFSLFANNNHYKLLLTAEICTLGIFTLTDLAASADANAVRTAFTAAVVYTACCFTVNVYRAAGLASGIVCASGSLPETLAAGITGFLCIGTSHSDIILGTIMILIVQATCYRTV